MRRTKVECHGILQCAREIDYLILPKNLAKRYKLNYAFCKLYILFDTPSAYIRFATVHISSILPPLTRIVSSEVSQQCCRVQTLVEIICNVLIMFENYKVTYDYIEKYRTNINKLKKIRYLFK